MVEATLPWSRFATCQKLENKETRQVTNLPHGGKERTVRVEASQTTTLSPQNHARRGADFLAYAILDAVIDGYFPLLEHYGERLDDLEDLITDDPPRRIVHELHEIRSVLRALRRVVWAHRDAIGKLLHDPTPLIHDETGTFLRDCFDHTLQLAELLETYHESCTDLRDVYLSSVRNRMNEVMKVLTIIATIFIPLGFIASLYGMNFNTSVSPWNMPELNWFFGYPFVVTLMLVVTFGLLAGFFSGPGAGWAVNHDS